MSFVILVASLTY